MAETSNESQALPPVLQLAGVSYRDTQRQSLTVRDVNLSLTPGELITVQVPLAIECRPFVSMLQGIRQPQIGDVLFDGQNWLGDDHQRHDQMRSRIGRVFEGTAWIENLNIYENVVLAQRHHHPDRNVADIDAEVSRLAKRFGIDSVTHQRPSFVGKTYLRICEWVRAFLGKPRLLLLEHPMRSVPAKYRQQLNAVLSETLNAGSAAIWFTRSDEYHDDDFKLPVRHFSITDQQLVPVG